VPQVTPCDLGHTLVRSERSQAAGFAADSGRRSALRGASAKEGGGRWVGHSLPGLHALAAERQVRADLLVDDFTKLPFQARIAIAR
jgi:hypothetical protein